MRKAANGLVPVILACLLPATALAQPDPLDPSLSPLCAAPQHEWSHICAQWLREHAANEGSGGEAVAFPAAPVPVAQPVPLRDISLDGGHISLSWGPAAGLTLFSLQGKQGVVGPSFGGGGLSGTMNFWPVGSCSVAMATAGTCTYNLHLSITELFGASIANGVNVPADVLALVLCGQLPAGLPMLCAGPGALFMPNRPVAFTLAGNAASAGILAAW